MIRIRFPKNSVVPALLGKAGESVLVVQDAAVIALESEKNQSREFLAVERLVRPTYQQAWKDGTRLFNVVAVETRAGCNYACSFCPVARSVDPRSPGQMSDRLLEKIAGELADLSFAGRLGLFGNNEPLLDDRLPRIVAMFRTAAPSSDIRILTNGTLATVELVVELFEAGLDTLVINNYTNGQHFIAPVRALIGAAAQLEPFDIRVSMRRRSEVLTTRGGLAPNKPRPQQPPRGFCALPFTDLHISYTGDVNLCCMDAHGRVSMGSAESESLIAIWHSRRFGPYRRSLLTGIRAGLTPCQSCDFDGFREPAFHKDRPLTRADFEVQLEHDFDE